VIHKVAYTFQQLSDWRDAVSDSILGKYGTEMVDLDEARNTVTISVPTAQQPALRQALSALGIPANAVFLREAKGIRTSSPRRASARLRHR